MDAMRAIAALIVCLGHARVLFIASILGSMAIGANTTMTAVGVPDTAAHANPAHQAVIVFFVMSGFFVGGGTLRAWGRSIWTWREYAIQRLTRLWIVLVPALLLTAGLDRLGISLFGLGGIYGGPIGQDSIAPHILQRLDAKTFFGCLFFLQDILTKTFGSDSPLWTLSYEFWFYIAFPLCLGAITKRYTWPWRIANVLLLVVAGFFVGPKIVAYFSLWLLGASLQLVPKKLTNFNIERLAATAFLAFLAVTMLLIVAQLRLFVSDIIEASACWGFCYVILHQTALAGNGIYTRLSKRLSDMSYTIYLTHNPILTFICAALMTPWIRWHLDVLHLFFYVLILGVTFCAQYALYWCFESRTEFARHALRKLLLAA